jgi:phage terminase large subunit
MTANATIARLRIPAAFIGEGGSVWNSAKPYQIWYGGRYSSKSWTKAIQWLSKAQSQRYFRGVFARDTQKNVRNAQFQLFKDLCRRFDCFRDQFHFVDSGMKIICKQNGNMMMGGSFEQPDTLRSVADPTDFWAEEPITRESQISRQDFFDIVGSLRNAEGVQTQFHFTFNPISKKTWIYEDFFENGIFDAEIVFVNYWDNPFCPQSGIEFLESLRRLDPKRYKVDGLGNWGIAHEGLIYKDYTPVDEMPEVQFYGLDFGFNDPCALVGSAVRDTPGQLKKDLFWQELLYETGHTSKSLIRRFETLKISKDIPMICDNSRPEMILDLQDAGFRAIACHKYKGSVRDGIGEVKNYNLKIVRGSRNLFDEIANYLWDQLPDGKLAEEPAPSMDHALDAGRYSLEAVAKNPLRVTEAERDAFAGISL